MRINGYPNRVLASFVVGSVVAVFVDVRAPAQCTEPACVVLRTYASANPTFGWAISELRDADGDGATDLLIGAPFAGVASAGRAVVISTAGGPAPVLFPLAGEALDQLGWSLADAGIVGVKRVRGAAIGAPSTGTSGLPGRVRVYSVEDGSVVHTITGEAPNDMFGYAVGNAGDVNNDGRDDLVIGAPFSDHRGANSGRAYVCSGLDGSVLWHLEATGPGQRFGSGVDGVGDVNADGVPDVAVAAPGESGPNGPGRLHVFSGATGLLLWSASASAGAFAYGEFFVAGVGDVNHDFRPDIYVGDYGHGGGAGRAYVYCGVSGAVLHEFAGMAGEGLGPGRGAGDVNGDGFDDLIIGAYTSSAGASTAGRSYIRSGRDGSIMRTITSNLAGEQHGYDAVGIGDIDADGRLDFAVSAANASRVYVFAGNITPLKPTDVNDDGSVDVDDLIAVILAWGPCIAPPAECRPYACVADVQTSGAVDVDDLIAVILSWG